MRSLQIYDDAASLYRREAGTSMAKKRGNSLKEKHRGKKSRLRTKRRGDRVQTKSKQKPEKILVKKFKKKRQMIGAGVRTLSIPALSGIGKNHDALINKTKKPVASDAELDKLNDDELACELDLGVNADEACERANLFGPQTPENQGEYRFEEPTPSDEE